MARKHKARKEIRVTDALEPVKDTIYTVPFELFATRKVDSGAIRKHQITALSRFFSKHGLTRVETPDAYEEIFKLF